MAVNKNFVVRNGLEVGGDTLFANGITDKVGIGTTNPTSTFTVKGGTSLQELSVSGVSTFTNSVAIGNTIPTSALTVVGSGTSTSQLYVTGVSTFRNNAYITDQNRLYFGDESLSISYQVVGITSANYIETFDHIPLNIITENLTIGASDGEVYANFKINSSVSLFYDNAKKFETSGLGVTVTGVTSTTYLYATGISTFIDGPVFIGSGTSTGTELQRLQVTGGGYFSSPVGIGITNPSNTLTVVGSGTSTSQLYVTGFSTFVGYSTFQDYVNIEDGLYVAGVSTFVGYSTFQDYVNIEDGLNVAGVSTFAGITTVTGETLFTHQFSVSGVSTHVGISTFESTLFANQLSVSGISTLGITTTTYLSAQELSVSGVSTAEYYVIRDIGVVGAAGTDLAITANYDLTILTDAAISGFSGPLWTFGKDGTLTAPGQINADSLNVTDYLHIVGAGVSPPPSTEIELFVNGEAEITGNVSIVGIVTAPTFVGNLTGTATTASTANILDTNGLTTVYYPTFVENRTDGQIIRADVDLTYKTDDNTLTVPNISSTQVNSSRLNVGTGGTVITTNDTGSVGIGTTTPVSKLSVVGGDASVGIDTSQGVILTSPNGTRYRLFVENNGTLKTVAI